MCLNSFQDSEQHGHKKETWAFLCNSSIAIFSIVIRSFFSSVHYKRNLFRELFADFFYL